VAYGGNYGEGRKEKKIIVYETTGLLFRKINNGMEFT
jgi:hypothetical protein